MSYLWAVENFEGRKIFTATAEQGGEEACNNFVKLSDCRQYLAICHYETKLLHKRVVVEKGKKVKRDEV